MVSSSSETDASSKTRAARASELRWLFQLVSLRHMTRAHPLRTTLTTLGVALGVAAVVAMAVASDSLSHALREVNAQIAGHAELVISGGSTGIPERFLEPVRAVPGVLRAGPLIRDVAVVTRVKDQTTNVRVQVLAIDAKREISLPDAAIRAEDIELARGEGALSAPHWILVTRSFATRHGLREAATRATVTLATPKGARELVVRGFFKTEGPERIFGGHFVVVDLASAQEAFGKSHRIDAVHVALQKGLSPEDQDETRQRIAAAVGPSFDVEPPRDRGRHADRALGTWRIGAVLLSLITLFVGALLIYNTVAVSVVERFREIGILRALGATRVQVTAMFAAEALAIGLAGAALGVFAGLSGARWLIDLASDLLSRVLEHTPVPSTHVTPGALVLGVLSGAAVALVAAFFPALRGARISPLEATRLTPHEPRRRALARVAAVASMVFFGLTASTLVHPDAASDEALAFGAALSLMAGFVLACPVMAPLLARAIAPIARALFGSIGRLAADNLVRAEGRATVTVGAIVVGFGLVISSSSIAKSFRTATAELLERTLPADVLVTAGPREAGGGARAFGPEVKEALAAVKGVLEVHPMRTVDVRVGDGRADLRALDVAHAKARGSIVLTHGRADAALDEVARGAGVLVSERFTHAFRARRGDLVAIRTPRGVERFKVSGVFVDFASPFGLVLADWKLFHRYFDDRLFDTFHVYARPAYDPNEVRKSIEAEVGGPFHAFVSSNADFKRDAARSIDEAFRLVHVQEAIALVVALLGLLNTLLIAVLERTREIGVLRAIGMTRRQVGAMIVIEALLIAIAGAVLGTALGAALSFVNVSALSIVHAPWRVGYQFDGFAALQMFAGSLVVAAAAAYLPGRRAARLVITQALEYE
jgi:putative ABC transport system permease protein